MSNSIRDAIALLPSVRSTEVPRIRLLIVDDHEMLADSLHLVFAGCPDIEVVGVVGTVGDAVAGALKLHPDVVLMDYHLPDGDGVAAVTQIKQNDPAIQLVMLTGSGEDERLARRAFEAGCSGFLSKSRSVDDLLAIVRAAHEGEVLITPAMLLKLLPPITRIRNRGGGVLSRRELEVLSVMAEGGSDKEIAKRLFVSLNTVRKHTQNIIRKLGAHSKLEAVVIAVREGLILPL
ncbi:MAG: response regulator transcription factor [Acidimicrobiales bacterium]|jgi:DNA-binding NarL/FixJ family response regulator